MRFSALRFCCLVACMSGLSGCGLPEWADEHMPTYDKMMGRDRPASTPSSAYPRTSVNGAPSPYGGSPSTSPYGSPSASPYGGTPSPYQPPSQGSYQGQYPGQPQDPYAGAYAPQQGGAMPPSAPTYGNEPPPIPAPPPWKGQ